MNAAELMSADSRSAPTSRLDRAIRVLAVLTVAANVIYLGALMLPGSPASVFVDVWLLGASQWIPAAVFWLVAVRTGFARWEVTLAAAGMTFNVAAETYFVLAMDSTGNLPSPSFADIGYLLYYPLTLLALVVLVRRQSRNARGIAMFDSTLAVLGAAAVLALVLGPIFEGATSEDTALGVVITGLYPLFDILLVAAVVAISASPTLRMGPRWQFLVIGLLLFAGADIAYALLLQEDLYVVGTPLDAAWSAGVALSALWVIGVDRVSPTGAPGSSNAHTLPVPAIAVLAGLGVLLVATQTSVPPVALVLAAATVALSAVPVMFRQATLVRLIEGQERVVARLKQLDKSKSQMIGTVSHEMRTPLTSILGFLELVLTGAAGPVSAEAKDMLRVADRNARRLESLVDNMLTMTTLELNGTSATTAPVSIDSVLQRVAESLRPLAEARGVTLTVASDEPFVVEGNESQLEQAFTNVMDNAVKFTDAGGSVRVEVTLAGRSAVQVAVIDTGIGIPFDEIPHLFDRFFRASNALDNVVPGTGLGLAIAHGIVQAHEGDVSVTSVVGEGTTFHITLPLKQRVSREKPMRHAV